MKQTPAQMPTQKDMLNAFGMYRKMKPTKYEMKFFKPFEVKDTGSQYDLDMTNMLNELLTMTLEQTNNIIHPSRLE